MSQDTDASPTPGTPPGTPTKPVMYPADGDTKMPFNYTFEVEAVQHESPGSTNLVRCENQDAEFWSVYRRPLNLPERKPALAEWLADCSTREIANILALALAERDQA